VTSSGEDFLTVAEIAAILKLNQQTVRNWIERGLLPALRIGRRVRVRRGDFERFLDQGRTTRPPASKSSAAQAFWDGDVPSPGEPLDTD